MKMQKPVIIVNGSLKINIQKKKNYQKVRDHCNYTGEYKGAAHSICNLKYIISKKIMITLHNESKWSCVTKCKDWEYCPEYTNVKKDSIEYRCLYCNKKYQKSLMKILKRYLLIHKNLLTMILISLFDCFEKVFTWIHGWLGKIQ